MGGGSSKSSSSNATQDNDVIVGEQGELLQDGSAQAKDGGVIATDEAIVANNIESVKKNAENISVENGGTGNTLTITQFGEDAAKTVRRAIDTLGSVTSKNLQLYTEKDLLLDTLQTEKSTISAEEFKALLSRRDVQVVLIGTGAAAIWYLSRKGKK